MTRPRGWTGRQLVALAVVTALVTWWLTPAASGVPSPLVVILAVFLSLGAGLVLSAIVRIIISERNPKR